MDPMHTACGGKKGGKYCFLNFADRTTWTACTPHWKNSMSEEEHTCRVVHDDILGHVCVMKFQFASAFTCYVTYIHTHTHTHKHILFRSLSLSLSLRGSLPSFLPPSRSFTPCLHFRAQIQIFVFQRTPRDLLQMSIYVESVDEEQVYRTRELDFCTVFAEEVDFAA
jgi:hypothetical protein